MYPAHLALTDKAIIALPFASAGQRIVRDVELPVFLVMIGKRRKTLTVQGDLRASGIRRSVRVKVGDVGDVKTREARAKAKELLGSIARGFDPRPKAPTSETKEGQANPD